MYYQETRTFYTSFSLSSCTHDRLNRESETETSTVSSETSLFRWRHQLTSALRWIHQKSAGSPEHLAVAHSRLSPPSMPFPHTPSRRGVTQTALQQSTDSLGWPHLKIIYDVARSPQLLGVMGSAPHPHDKCRASCDEAVRAKHIEILIYMHVSMHMRLIIRAGMARLLDTTVTSIRCISHDLHQVSFPWISKLLVSCYKKKTIHGTRRILIGLPG